MRQVVKACSYESQDANISPLLIGTELNQRSLTNVMATRQPHNLCISK